jgi:class 3 adenylate cyclase
LAKAGYKECPYCAEEIREAAIKCRYCQTMLIQQDVPQPVLPTNIPSQDHSEIQRLSQFIPAQVIQGIISGSEMMDEGERRNISILFADISGFTSLAETLDPEDLKDMIDGYLGEMAEVIAKYNGTVDKFMGDAVMALYGAPITHENDPELAIRAAMEIRNSVEKRGVKLKNDLKVHIGISCGDVIVGGLSGKSRLDYTAIGDVVNLAQRLQSAAKPGQIIVSQRIFERTQNSFEFQSLGPIQLKGKAEPVHAYLPNKPIREYDKMPIRKISSPELVGRDTELQLLLNVIKECKKGNGIVIHLKGESGVGKSRLIYEVRKKSAGLNVQFHYGRCLSYGKNSPYLPIVDLLIRGICGVPDTISKEEASKQVEQVLLKLSRDLKPDIPYIQYFVSPEMVTAEIAKEDPKIRMQKIFNAVQHVIEKSARQKPLILEFEDLQWADQLTLTLLNHLIPAIANIPVVFFFVYRPYFTTSWKTDAKQIEIELKELSTLDSEKLVRQLLGYAQLSSGLIEKIMQKTEGNPFYTEEVILYLEQTGILESTREGWKLTKPYRKLRFRTPFKGLFYPVWTGWKPKQNESCNALRSSARRSVTGCWIILWK